MSSNKEASSYIDKHIGLQIRERRTLMGISQSQVAHFLDITFQQVQKYESGVNRVSASRLYEISKLLDVNIGYFFEGSIFGDNGNRLNEAKSAWGNKNQSVGASLNRDTLELVRYFNNIKNTTMRRKVLDMIRLMSKDDN